MKMTLERKNSIIILTVIFISFIAYAFKFLYSIFKIDSAIISVIAFGFLIYLNRKELNANKKRMILVYTLQILILILSFFITNTGIGSIINMMIVTTILLITPYIKIDSFTVKILRFFLPFYYLLFMIVPKEHLNTNYVGYIFLCLYILSIIVFNLYHKKNRIILLLFSVLNLILILLFRCRTAMLCCLMFLVLILIPKKWYNKKVLKRIVPIGLIFGSLLFAYMYVFLWKHDFYIDLTFFVKKSLYSGRNRVWNEAFSLLIENPIFGVGSKYHLTSIPAYALHNTVFMVTLTFGIPNLLLYFVNFRSFFSKICDRVVSNNFSKVVYASIIVLFFVDFFESYTYWSNYNFLLFLIIVLALNKNNCFYKKENNEKQKVYIFEEGIDRIGGVERVISVLSNNFAKYYNVKVISFYKTRNKPFFKYNKNVSLHYLTNQQKKRSSMCTNKNLKYYFYRTCEKLKELTVLRFKLIEQVEEIKQDDVVIMGRVDVALMVIPLMDSYKKIIVRDAIHYYYQRPSIQKKIKLLFKKTKGVLFVSSDESKKVYEDLLYGSKMKIEKVYNPIGINIRVKYNYNNKQIITIGRYAYQKGYENLIAAFEIVHKYYPDWRLMFVGEGHSSELQKLIQKSSARDNILLHNSTNDIVPLLNESSIYVMTSRYEGYANSLVEAVGCGVPSVSYDWLLGVNEIIHQNETGIVTPLKDRFAYAKGINNPEDIEHLATDIMCLIKDQKLCDFLSKNGSLYIKKSRNLDKIIKKWREEIDE